MEWVPDNRQPYDTRDNFYGQAADPVSNPHRMSYQQDGAQSSAADRRSGNSIEAARFGFNRASSQKNKKGLLGLSNLGNTCFMNAALQCLTHSHGIQKYFRFCSHAYTSKGQSSRQKLLMAFANWFERDWGKNVSAPYHSPEDILRAVQTLNPTFQGYSQQDSQEFLRCVLDCIHEELRKEVPDDIPAHLLRNFGIESQGETSPSSSSQSSRRGALPNSDGEQKLSSSGHQEVAAGARGKVSPTASAPSTTRQFMQLCQSTEGVTDVDEIRLPEAQSSGSRETSDASLAPPSGSGAAGGASSSSSSSKDGGEKKPPGHEDGDAAAAKTHFSSIVSELFQGRVVSVVQCLECHKTSRTEEVIYDVSVPIPNSNEVANGPGAVGIGDPSGSGSPQFGGGTRGSSWTGMISGLPGKVKGWFYDKGVEITECLRKYSAPEYLTGKDKYYCEHCKQKNDCEKRIVFKELPEVLCIHIKRFRYEAGWLNNGTKNSKVVTFPVTKPLEMSGFLDEGATAPVEYRLIGLIQHIGSMGGGHYIAYCLHKRRPQDWYEFDDLQVSQVSAEQVERAEPYVLFYQRLPSKGNKLDRQTFKSDQRNVQSRIRQYLINRSSCGDPSAPLLSTSSAADGAASQMAAQVDLQGPALRNLYRKPPAELDVVFVSKHWYVRLTSMSDPGPLDNYLYLCPHQLLGSCSAEMAAEPFIPISHNLWKSLVRKYGGGPKISSLELCTKCQTHLRAYNDRKQAEFDLVSKYDTKDTGEGTYWYLVDALWVNKWKRYVRAEHVTAFEDMSSPGSITNERLFDKDDPNKPRANLRLRIDYIGVNARVWWLFMHVHGGGPVICRQELDIYSQECRPEKALCLEELNEKDPSDLACRISWQFVDDCKGDRDAYDRKYVSHMDTESPDAMKTDDNCGEPAEPMADEEKRLQMEVAELRREKAVNLQDYERRSAALRARQERAAHEGARPAEDQSLRVESDRLDQELAHAQRALEERITAKEEEMQSIRAELQRAGTAGADRVSRVA